MSHEQKARHPMKLTASLSATPSCPLTRQEVERANTYVSETIEAMGQHLVAMGWDVDWSAALDGEGRALLLGLRER